MVNSEEGSTERRFTLEELIAPTELVIPEPPAAIGVGKEGEPRLMIKQIVNENFKSYAGRKIIGPFHKAFTSIVGPNGSGKSNVIDSMLFVFGYRAQKIRSKKVSVLIHNSEKHVNLRSCTVEVHFHMIVDKEGENEYDVIPGSEIVVSRTAFKDNSSYYSIDGRKTNFKEVSTLLKGKGIDLVHNRFLILQGEVEQISQMKPKAENPNEEGMLEYLEDIIGSSRLKPLIDTLNVKVEQLDVYRTEKNNRVKLAEEEMKKLEGGYEEAKKYLELKNRHTRNQNVIFQSQVFAKNNHIRKLEEDQVTVSEKISELQTKQNDFVAENKEIFKAHAKAKKKVGKIENTVNQLSDKKGEMESKNTILNEELKQKKTRKKKLGGEMEKAQKKVEEFTAMPEKCEHEQNELNEKLEDLKAAEIRQESQLQEVISSVEKETTELRNLVKNCC